MILVGSLIGLNVLQSETGGWTESNIIGAILWLVAAVAVAHTILVIAYHLPRDPGTVYEDFGVRYCDECDRQATERRAVARLEAWKLSATPSLWSRGHLLNP